jgi:hypothetical protein
VYSVVAVCDSSMGMVVVVCSVLVPLCKAMELPRGSKAGAEDTEDTASGGVVYGAVNCAGAAGDHKAGGKVAVVVPLVVVAVVVGRGDAT